MSGQRTLIALSTAIALGVLGAASVAQANDSGENRGGFVMPGSAVGVNPVFPPGGFGKTRSASDAYASAPLQIEKQRPVTEHVNDRTDDNR